MEASFALNVLSVPSKSPAMVRGKNFALSMGGVGSVLIPVSPRGVSAFRISGLCDVPALFPCDSSGEVRACGVDILVRLR